MLVRALLVTLESIRLGGVSMERKSSEKMLRKKSLE